MNMMISYQELVRTFLNITELINKAAENGYSLRVVDDRDSTETPATYASPHQLL